MNYEHKYDKKSLCRVFFKRNLRVIFFVLLIIFSIEINTYANEEIDYSSNDYINCNSKNQATESVCKIFSLREFDEDKLSGELSMKIDVVLPLNMQEYLLIGGWKHSDVSDGDRKGSLIGQIKNIYKINIQTREIEQICKTNGKRYINAELIDDDRILLVGFESIEILNLRNKSIEQIFLKDGNHSSLHYSGFDYSYLLNSERLLYSKNAGRKIYIYDLINKKLIVDNSFPEKHKYLFGDKLLLNQDTILFYNGVDLEQSHNPIDKNYVYKIKNNKFKEDFKIGHIQHIAKISDEKYLIIRSEKIGKKIIDDRRFYEYKYGNAVIYNSAKRKIEKELIIPFKVFQSNSLVPMFNSIKIKNNILIFEDYNGLRYIYNIEKECFENIDKNFEFNNEIIQKTIKINENQILILTDKSMYIYTYEKIE